MSSLQTKRYPDLQPSRSGFVMHSSGATSTLPSPSVSTPLLTIVSLPLSSLPLSSTTLISSRHAFPDPLQTPLLQVSLSGSEHFKSGVYSVSLQLQSPLRSALTSLPSLSMIDQVPSGFFLNLQMNPSFGQSAVPSPFLQLKVH